MYRQEDHGAAQAEAKKRWIVTMLPGALLWAAGIVVFVVCQSQRQDWGWIFASACTIVGGAYVLFFYGVYLKPVLLYKRHVGYMLEGRKRETTGLLQEVAQEIVDKDGLDCYAITVNVGERNDPEDERLFYVDALKGRPDIPLGSLVTVVSNDKMVAALRVG